MEERDKLKEKLVKSDKLRSVVDKLDRVIEEKQKAKYPKAGMGVELARPIPKEKAFSFGDSKIEGRFQASKGVVRPSSMQTFRETMASLKNKMTRTYEYLPNTAENIKAKTALKNLEKQRGVTYDKTARILQGITAKQGKQEHNLFVRKIILDDLKHEADLGHDLPFGFTKEVLNKEMSRLKDAMEKYLRQPL